MLIKKILAALPLSPAPKRLPKQVEFCAGATVRRSTTPDAAATCWP